MTLKMFQASDVVVARDPERQRAINRARERALVLNEWPPPWSDDFVRCRGEELSHPIYWRGTQWAATEYGVECRDGCYVIEANRIWEDEDKFGWVRHMAGKEWVYLDDFAEALRVARMVGKMKHPRNYRAKGGG